MSSPHGGPAGFKRKFINLTSHVAVMKNHMEQVEGFLLSSPQSRLWQLQQAFGHDAFHTQFRVLIEGPLDHDLLERSIRSVIEKHEILRTNFCPAPELAAPLQVVSDDVAFSLQEFDLSRLSTEEREREIVEVLQSDRHSSGYESGPALKLALLYLADNKHLLLITLPSLCADAETAWPLVEDLGRAYAGRIEGQERREVVIQYSQFSEWQNQMLAGEDGEAGRNFWRKQNIFPLPASPLPFAKKSTGGRRFDPRRYECSIGLETAQRLDEVVAKRGPSLPVFLLACWQAMLWRLTGQAELTIGLVADGRKYAEMESMPGLFNRCLPLRFGIGPGMRFSEIVQKAVDSVRLASEWQESFSFETGAAGFPEVTYVPICYEFNELPAPIVTGEVSFSLEAIESRVDRFDLALACFRKEAALTAAFDFNPDLYDAESVKRMARYFSAILESALQNDEATVEELNLLPEEERRHLLIELNRTARSFPDDGPVHRIFERQAELSPDRLALASGEEHLTFTELNARANRLSRRLLKSGIGPESVVGVLMWRSAEMIVAILGTLKAGAAYLPLDPAYPRERTGFMLDDAGAALLLTHERLQDGLPEFNGRLLFIDREWAQIAEESAKTPEVELAADNLAYVIYTSGSTGRPKGTTISHRGLTNYLNWAAQAYEIEQGAGAPLHSSTAFDLSVTSLFGPLIAGRAVALPRATTSVESLSSALRERENFSLVKATPAHARLLSQQLEPEEVPGRTRFLILGGEALSAQDISFWRDCAPETRIVNEYGPTETVVGCCAYQLDADSPDADSIPIGRPIANTQIYLLDRLTEPAPVGAPGELYIAGAGLARGYFNRPDLTAEKFLPNPFSPEPGARMYRSGDLARYLPDGNIEFLGRGDEQLKIRGYRIEPGEIAAALSEHAAVREALVVAKEDGRGEPRLVAYLVAENEGLPFPSVGELRGFLETKLPDYMIPAAYVRLEELPLNANGKVDRRALPEPHQARPGKRTWYAAPRTPEEEVLAGVWSQVLGTQKVGIDDGYFALGGDSIRSLQVVALAKKRGLRLTVDQLFRHQTIRELAKEIRESESEQESPPRVGPYDLISPEDREKITGDIEDAYPLSRLQAGMIFHREYHPESAIYHDICSFHLRSPLNLELMKEAVAQLASRHAALRSSFDLTSFSEPLNLVHRQVSIPLGVEDISHLAPEAQEAALTEWIETEKKRDFDYATPPLLRFHIHVRSAETFQFTLSFHHAILDGWSDATMITELAVSYYRLLRGETIPFRPPATLYRDFIALEKQAIEDESARRFWLDRLEGSEPSMAPRWESSATSTDIRPEQAGRRGIARWDIHISKEVSEGLKDLALKMAVPVKSVLLAAHMRALSLLTGTHDVVTFLTAVGRPETDEGDRVLGLFLNSAPFRLKLDGGTWNDLVKMAFEAEYEALPFRRYPMAEMQRLRGGARLAETGFYFTHYYIYRDLEEFPEFKLLDAEFYEETSITFLANFAIDAFSSDVRCYLTCDRTQIGEEQLKAIGGYYAEALAALARDPNEEMGRTKVRPVQGRNKSSEMEGARYESPFVAPRTPQEEVLAGIWSRILGAPEVGIDDDYFVLGGDSIRSIQIVSLARKKGLRFTLEEVFKHRTIRQLAEAIRDAEAATAAAGPEPFSLITGHDRLKLPGDVEDAYPLTRLQAGMIYHREMDPNAAIYHDIFSLHLKAPFDIDALRQAVRELSERHPALRTSFDLTGFSEPLQMVHRKATIPLGVEDLRSLTPAEQETALAAWIEAEKRRGFNHTRPPLLRFQAHLRGAETFQFTLSFHHAILDGWSDATMLTELAISYLSLLRGAKSPYEAPRAQFRDFVALEREALESAECRSYWLEKFADCEPGAVPRWEASPEQDPGADTRGVFRQAAAMPEDVSDGLQKLALTEAAPLKDVLLAAHMKVVSLLSERSDVVTTVTSSGRPETGDSDRALGLFLNSMPFRLRLDGGTWRDLIQMTFEAEREALPFRRYPLAELQRLRGGGRISEMTFYFTHYHVYHNLRRFAELEVLNLKPYEETSFAIVAMFGLDPFTARLTLQLSCDKTRISEEQARTYADYYGRVLTEMASNPGGRYDLFLPLSQKERHQSSVERNGKIDLPAPSSPAPSQPELGSPYVAPKTPLEKALASIWSSVLGIEEIGIHDSFFELGGHSLTATQAVSRIRAEFQAPMPLRDFLSAPTIAALAERLETIQWAAREPGAPTPVERFDEYEI